MDRFNLIRQKVDRTNNRKEKKELYSEMINIGKRSIELNDKFRDSKMFYSIGESCLKYILNTIKSEMTIEDDF